MKTVKRAGELKKATPKPDKKFTYREVVRIRDEIGYRKWFLEVFHARFQTKNPGLCTPAHLAKIISISKDRRATAKVHHRSALAESFGWTLEEFKHYLATGIRPSGDKTKEVSKSETGVVAAASALQRVSLPEDTRHGQDLNASNAVAAYLEHLRIDCRIHRDRLFPAVKSKTGTDQIDTGAGGNLIPLFLVEQGLRVSMLDAMMQSKRLLLIGRPGAGKTALTLITSAALLDRKWQLPTPGHVGLQSPLPVLIRLRDMADAMFSARESRRPGKGLEFENALEFMADHLAARGLSKEFFNQTRGTGAYVFLFDGLDEVPFDYHIDTVLARLNDQIRDDWMVVSTRPRSDEVIKVLGPSFWRLHLSDLTTNDKWDLLRKRFENRTELEAFWTRLNGLPSDWAELTSTPLILSVLAYLFQIRLLHDKWDLCTVYDLTIEVLLGEYSDARTGRTRRLERGQRVRLFDALCAASFEKNSGRIDTHLNVLVSQPDYWPWPGGSSKELLDSFWDVDDAPMFPGPPDKREPLHRTFMEFGYARFLSTLLSDPTERILTHWQEYEQTSLVPLFFVKLDGGARADQLETRLAEAVDDDSPRTFLAYARVVYNAHYLQQRHKEKLEPKLLDLWRTGAFRAVVNHPLDTEITRGAARCLGLDPYFVGQVCNRLEHPTDDENLSMTADLLKDMRSPHCYPQLITSLDAKDNRVRWAAAVSLGELSYYATVHEFLMNHRFEREKDWDVQMAMLTSAGKVRSDQFGKLLALAMRKSGHEVVRWQAEIVAQSICGGGHIENLTAADSAARSAANADEAAKILTEITNEVWSGFASEKQKCILEATAAISKVEELSLAFRRVLSRYLVPRLIKALHQTPTNKKKTWQVAWSLRSLLNLGVSPHVNTEDLSRILDKLEPIKYGLARGEIMAVFGEMKAVAAVPCLCRHYSLRNDEHERNWTIHSLWQIAHSELLIADLQLVRATCEQAATLDSYERTRHWARLTLRLVERKD